MMASRTVTRATARNLRAPIRTTRQVRFASTTQGEAAKAGGFSDFGAGIAGGATVFLAGYSYYHFSGAKSVVNAYSTTKNKIQSATSQLTEKAPEPSQAINWLRKVTSGYAAFIPGAQSYLDTAFDDLEKVQQKHADEVEKIVKKSYEDLKAIGNQDGASMEGVVKSWSVLQRTVSEIGELAKDSTADILENHPQIKEKFGGSFEQLKNMADAYGPEAKKQLDDTTKQVADILKGGMGLGAMEKVRKLVQEKTEAVKELGNKAWEKGMEEWKPYLEKNPKVKEILEKNTDILKSGNLKETFEQVKRAVEGNSTDDLEKYVKQAGEKAKSSGLGQQIESYAKMVPGSEEIWKKMASLSEVAKDHGEELEGLVKGAYKDVEEVLKKRLGEAEQLKEKAEKDAKKA